MGEAKRKGTASERVAAAQLRDAVPVSIKHVAEKCGIPEGYKFLGYVIHVPETDDYLSVLDETIERTKRGYSVSPEQALVFNNFEKAARTAMSLPKQSVVGLLFDIGKQYRVVFNLPEEFEAISQQLSSSPYSAK